jgi:nucleotide-binding universal stress UspA family protein
MAPALLDAIDMMVHRASIKKILCPTDFSDFSERALTRAMGLGRSFNASVTALHSISFGPPPVVLPGEAGLNLPPVFLAEKRTETEARMKALQAAFADAALPLETVIAEGEPWIGIEACARELPADLIVMGTHGTGGWNRFLMGSTTEQVIRRVRCPVLTVGPHDEAQRGLLFKRILCAVDLSAQSPHSVETALAFAEENLASATFLLHVMPAPREEWAPFPLLAASNTQYQTALREGALAELEKLSRGFESHCSVRPLAEFGTAWREIVRVATDEQCDLIVTGAHGKGGLGPFFVGSTAGQVMRHAPCPVLIVRGGASAHAS